MSSLLFSSRRSLKIEPQEMRERAKSGARAKKREGGEEKLLLLLPSPSHFFLSSLHFSGDLSSLKAQFSTISWRKRGDYSQSTLRSKSEETFQWSYWFQLLLENQYQPWISVIPTNLLSSVYSFPACTGDKSRTQIFPLNAIRSVSWVFSWRLDENDTLECCSQ